MPTHEGIVMLMCQGNMGFAVPEGATWGVPDPDFGGAELPANKATLADVLINVGSTHRLQFFDQFAALLRWIMVRCSLSSETEPVR